MNYACKVAKSKKFELFLLCKTILAESGIRGRNLKSNNVMWAKMALK